MPTPDELADTLYERDRNSNGWPTHWFDVFDLRTLAREAAKEALLEAAEIAHSEARWQWENDLRRVAGAQIVAQRMQMLERIFRNRAEQIGKETDG